MAAPPTFPPPEELIDAMREASQAVWDCPCRSPCNYGCKCSDHELDVKSATYGRPWWWRLRSTEAVREPHDSLWSDRPWSCTASTVDEFLRVARGDVAVWRRSCRNGGVGVRVSEAALQKAKFTSEAVEHAAALLEAWAATWGEEDS